MKEDYYWDTANETNMGKYLTRRTLKFICGFLDVRYKCLDVASGSGRFSIPISKRGIDVVAVDLDIVPLKKLAGNLKDVMIIRGDANRLPFHDSSFDCIISLETIDYLSVADILKEYKRVPRDDGYLIINISNRCSYKGYVQRFLSPYRTFYRHSLSDMKLCLSDEGFKILICKGYNWIPFRRGSNHALIPMFDLIEDSLHLGHLANISPWVIIAAYKSGEPK